MLLHDKTTMICWPTCTSATDPSGHRPLQLLLVRLAPGQGLKTLEDRRRAFSLFSLDSGSKFKTLMYLKPAPVVERRQMVYHLDHLKAINQNRVAQKATNRRATRRVARQLEMIAEDATTIMTQETTDGLEAALLLPATL